jgi:hypothetical protein
VKQPEPQPEIKQPEPVRVDAVIRRTAAVVKKVTCPCLIRPKHVGDIPLVCGRPAKKEGRCGIHQNVCHSTFQRQKCEAVTKAGKACGKMAVLGTRYCTLHKDVGKKPAPAPVPVPVIPSPATEDDFELDELADLLEQDFADEEENADDFVEEKVFKSSSPLEDEPAGEAEPETIDEPAEEMREFPSWTTVQNASLEDIEKFMKNIEVDSEAKLRQRVLECLTLP